MSKWFMKTIGNNFLAKNSVVPKIVTVRADAKSLWPFSFARAGSMYTSPNVPIEDKNSITIKRRSRMLVKSLLYSLQGELFVWLPRPLASLSSSLCDGACFLFSCLQCPACVTTCVKSGWKFSGSDWKEVFVQPPTAGGFSSLTLEELSTFSLAGERRTSLWVEDCSLGDCSLGDCITFFTLGGCALAGWALGIGLTSTIATDTWKNIAPESWMKVLHENRIDSSVRQTFSQRKPKDSFCCFCSLQKSMFPWKKKLQSFHPPVNRSVPLPPYSFIRKLNNGGRAIVPSDAPLKEIPAEQAKNHL